MTEIERVFEYIEQNEANFIDRLREAIEIPSVSGWPDHRPKITDMAVLLTKRFFELGATDVALHQLGEQTLPDGSTLPLPPVVTAFVGNDPAKKNLLVYGHFDVMPAKISDGWDTEPFELVEKPDGRLCGRGTSDDKGPIVGWLNTIESFKTTKTELPVNIRFLLEGMEESGSVGLDDFIHNHTKSPIFQNLDFCVIVDTTWIGTKKPCLGYGLRGIIHCNIEVTCSKVDLHSGMHGGTVYEAMPDLLYLLGSLVDVHGKILITGIMDEVNELTEAEQKLYEKIDFSVEERRMQIGASKLVSDDKITTLMSLWRYPSLTIHGIEGAFSDPGCKTVIPGNVIGKFSIRLVPSMTLDKMKELITNHIHSLWSARGSPNEMKLHFPGFGRWWLADYNNENYAAARRATQLVYGIEPDLVREGGSIPVALSVGEAAGQQPCLLAFGKGDDGAHAQNEKLDKCNFINGMKLMASYLMELAR